MLVCDLTCGLRTTRFEARTARHSVDRGEVSREVRMKHRGPNTQHHLTARKCTGTPSPKRTWRNALRICAVTATLLAIAHPNVASATCEQIVQQLKELDAQRQASGGCNATPPYRPIPRPAGPDAPGRTPCIPDAAKAKAWMKAHQSQYDALVQQLSACDAAACPAISPITPCHCPKTVSPKLCACTLTRDSDGDGIPDAWEAKLIARFSPFLRFTLDDNVSDVYHPADPLKYISGSELVSASDGRTFLPNSQLAADPYIIIKTLAAGSPSQLLDGFLPNSNFSACPNTEPKTDYALRAIPNTPGTLMGEDWSEVTAAKNIGMFAHVSPFTPNSSQDLPSQCPLMIDKTHPVIPPSGYEKSCKHCYKIEYYQLFGFNNPHAPLDIGFHEGDWSILTVVYDADLDKMLAVSHWAHGYEMRFDRLAGESCQQVDVPLFGSELLCKGVNNDHNDFQIVGGSDFKTQQQPQYAENNQVSFAADPTTGEFSHPVAFVEFGSHEFWPSEKWSARAAPQHTGDDSLHSYLTQDITNLGEVEHPMDGVAQVIVGYSGSWGYDNEFNSPPPGPALHKAWNWWAKQRSPILCSAAE